MSTNMALILSKEIKQNPLQIAKNFIPYVQKYMVYLMLV